MWTLSTKFWTKGDVGEVSIESLCSDEVELPTDDAVVSIDILRSEDIELPDASVEGSDIMESWRDTESHPPSFVVLICRNSGCWLQTARNVSLGTCVSQPAINVEKGGYERMR